MEEVFKGRTSLDESRKRSSGAEMERKTAHGTHTSEQVDIGILEQEGKSRVCESALTFLMTFELEIQRRLQVCNANLIWTDPHEFGSGPIFPLMASWLTTAKIARIRHKPIDDG